MKIKKKTNPLYTRVRTILESSRSNVARSVNTTQVIANWLIGREIVEEEQGGRSRAVYGNRLLEALSKKLTRDFGAGYSAQNLRFIRQLYLEYPLLLGDSKIRYALRSESHSPPKPGSLEIRYAARSELNLTKIPEVTRKTSWKPGLLNPNLSWTHYRTLLRVDKAQARAFYEIEAIKSGWSARELERQINTLLYERLALSKDKKGLLRLAKKGHEVQSPMDVFKDPMVMEFVGLPSSPKLLESNLEQALIDNLQTFLLELGRNGSPSTEITSTSIRCSTTRS